MGKAETVRPKGAISEPEPERPLANDIKPWRKPYGSMDVVGIKTGCA